MSDTNKVCQRYTFIIVTKSGDLYCYDYKNNKMKKITSKKDEVKMTLPSIDCFTCNYESQEMLAKSFGITDEIQYSCIKYYVQGSIEYIRPVYNNEKWNKVAKGCSSTKVDLDDKKDKYNIQIFYKVYDALTDPQSNYASFVLKKDNKRVKISGKLENLLISLVSHERVMSNKKQWKMPYTPEDIEDHNKFIGDLKDRLRHYRELRALYLTYYYYFSNPSVDFIDQAHTNNQTQIESSNNVKQKTKENKSKRKEVEGQLSFLGD